MGIWLVEYNRYLYSYTYLIENNWLVVLYGATLIPLTQRWRKVVNSGWVNKKNFYGKKLNPMEDS